MPTPLIVIITLFVLNWIIRILIRKNPQNKSLMKLSFFISFSMIAYTIYYFFFTLPTFKKSEIINSEILGLFRFTGS